MNSKEDLRSYKEIKYDISSQKDIKEELNGLNKVKIVINSVYTSLHPDITKRVYDENFNIQKKRYANLVSYLHEKKINTVIIFNKVDVILIKPGCMHQSKGYIDYLDYLFDDYFNNNIY